MTDTTQKQLRILSSIARLHHSIGAHLDLKDISNIVIEELSAVVECPGAALLLIDRKRLKILAEKGFTALFRKKAFSVDMPIIKEILETRQGFNTGDASKGPAASCMPRGCKMSSILCVPVVIGEEVRGIIHLDSPKKNAFDDDVMHFVELTAHEIAFVMERSFLYSRIKDLSVRDGLTGCFNRRKFDEDIEIEIERAKRYRKPFSILMMDIDWFKMYNDFHGHQMGDMVLRKFVGVVTRNIRITDMAYRYGGEEFIVLLPEATKEKASCIARKLNRIIQNVDFPDARDSQPGGKITVSVGVANFPRDAVEREKLISSADAALYQAKHKGRNRVCMYEKRRGSASKARSN